MGHFADSTDRALSAIRKALSQGPVSRRALKEKTGLRTHELEAGLTALVDGREVVRICKRTARGWIVRYAIPFKP